MAEAYEYGSGYGTIYRGDIGSTFPKLPSPLRPATDYGTRSPSRDAIGTGLSQETKNRLGEALSIGLERLVSRIKPGPTAITPYERSPELARLMAQRQVEAQTPIFGIPKQYLLLAGLGLGIFLLAKKL